MQALKQANEEKVILLENVSTISLDADRSRIVFNFMNPIQLVGRRTPDYHYFEYPSSKYATEAFDAIVNNPHIKLNFLVSENSDNTDIVNIKAITSMLPDEQNLKIVFNLNYPVTSYRERDNRSVEISKVIFWNYKSESPYEGDILEIANILDIQTV